MTVHLGLDLGGTFLKWAIVGHEGGEWRCIDSGSAPTPADGGASAIVAELIGCAREASARYGPVASIGIAVPGRYDAIRGTVRFTPNIHVDWSGVPVVAAVSEAVGVPAHLVNDARAFTLAGLRLGAGRGAATMVGITLGTGVGGGIAVAGRLHLGLDGAAGEVGHLTIDPDGPRCGCGSRGCVETYAQAQAIAAACGTETAEEAVEAARAGDGRAMAGLAEAGRYLGIAVAGLVTLLTPDVVVFGGGVANAGELLLGPVRDELRSRVHMTSPESVRLVQAELGTLAGAIGAAVFGAEASAATGGAGSPETAGPSAAASGRSDAGSSETAGTEGGSAEAEPSPAAVAVTG